MAGKRIGGFYERYFGCDYPDGYSPGGSGWRSPSHRIAAAEKGDPGSLRRLV